MQYLNHNTPHKSFILMRGKLLTQDIRRQSCIRPTQRELKANRRVAHTFATFRVTDNISQNARTLHRCTPRFTREDLKHPLA